jgi:hypothetical protein
MSVCRATGAEDGDRREPPAATPAGRRPAREIVEKVLTGGRWFPEMGHRSLKGSLVERGDRHAALDLSDSKDQSRDRLLEKIDIGRK